MPTHRITTALLLGLLCFLLYLTNVRPMAMADSIPARLVPFSILREGNLDLNEFPWLAPFRWFSPDAIPYFLHENSEGRWFSVYSIAGPLLVTPLSVPMVWYLESSKTSDEDVRFRLATVVMERIGAAAIAAASVALVFLSLCSFSPRGRAVGMALVYGVGTGIWSTGSQAMWEHGPAALALAGLSLSLVKPAGSLRAVAAGGFSAFAVLARPSMVVFSLVALLFMLFERRRHVTAFLVFPVLGAAAMLVYKSVVGNPLLGGYTALYFQAPSPEALAGLLVSPNRGFLVYTPMTALALGIPFMRDRDLPRWLYYLLMGIGGYLLLYASWEGWFGGDSYGPRYLTDVLPAAVLCATPVVGRLWRIPWGRALVVVLACWGVLVQIIGVYYDDQSWNRTPADPPPEDRVWDLSDPQILRAARAGWHGFDFIPLLHQAVGDPRPALIQRLASQDLIGHIELEDPPIAYRPGASYDVDLIVRNGSDVAWPAFVPYGPLTVTLDYGWWNPGFPYPVKYERLPLPYNLHPGESARIGLHLHVPAIPGSYQLRFEIVQRTDLMKYTRGGGLLELPVDVR